MLYKCKTLTLETVVYSWYVDEYCCMGPSGRFYSCIYLLMLMIGIGGSWVELPVQGRLCPIFMSRVRLLDIHEFSAG